MKILIVHTAYQIKGGEDSVFQQETELLRNNGVLVKQLIFKNDKGLKGAFDFGMSIWNCRIRRLTQKMLSDFNPDIVHLHNWHFAAGPALIRFIKKEGFPVVVTIHNYRLLCPSANLLHNGEVFVDSLTKRFPWKAVRYKLYRGSALQTFWLAFINWFHRWKGTWQLIDRYLVLTEFAKELFLSSVLSIDSRKIVVKPNSTYANDSPDCLVRRDFLFVGRLTAEKGINPLLKAFQRTGLKLTIIGTGDMQSVVEQAATNFKNITYLGRKNRGEVLDAMRHCSALIFPSIWYEGMPMTIIEAFSMGTPVIANKLGAMESMIEDGVNGLHFNQSIDDLVSKISYWNNLSDIKKKEFSKAAIDSYKMRYTPEKNLHMLLSIYESVLDEGKKKSN